MPIKNAQTFNKKELWYVFMLNKIKHYETYEWKERASLKYSETYSKQTMETGYRMGIFVAKFTLIKVPQI